MIIDMEPVRQSDGRVVWCVPGQEVPPPRGAFRSGVRVVVLIIIVVTTVWVVWS
jgi:hypothetical protein